MTATTGSAPSRLMLASVEDARASGPRGHRVVPARWRPGVSTALEPAEGRTHRIGRVIGAIRAIALADGRLTLTEAGGETRSLSFDDDFL